MIDDPTPPKVPVMVWLLPVTLPKKAGDGTKPVKYVSPKQVLREMARGAILHQEGWNRCHECGHAVKTGIGVLVKSYAKVGLPVRAAAIERLERDGLIRAVGPAYELVEQIAVRQAEEKRRG